MTKIGWVDFNENDRRKAIEFIKTIQGQGSVDEFGYGTIRDRFSDIFFPGTSTIQTILEELEETVTRQKQRLSKNELIEKLHKEEFYCAYTMLNNEEINERDHSMIIGNKNLLDKEKNVSKDYSLWVKRNPSEIYWSGIKTFEIFNQPISLSGFINRILYVHPQDYDYEKDNKKSSELIENNGSSFDLPEYDNNWKETLKISLTPEEAEFLKDKIIRSEEKTQTHSLLGYMLTHDEIHTENFNTKDFQSFCSYLNKNIKIDDELLSTIELANSFNNFLLPIRYFYNYLITRKDDKKYEDICNQWEKSIKSLKEVANKCELKAIFAKFADINKPIDGETQKFFKNVQKIFLNNEKLNQPEIEKKLTDILSEREKDLKGENRSKIINKIPIDTATDEIHLLDYRFRHAWQLVYDIYCGLNEKNDSSEFSK